MRCDLCDILNVNHTKTRIYDHDDDKVMWEKNTKLQKSYRLVNRCNEWALNEEEFSIIIEYRIYIPQTLRGINIYLIMIVLTN